MSGTGASSIVITLTSHAHIGENGSGSAQGNMIAVVGIPVMVASLQKRQIINGNHNKDKEVRVRYLVFSKMILIILAGFVGCRVGQFWGPNVMSGDTSAKCRHIHYVGTSNR